jgi:hypothetical protein
MSNHNIEERLLAKPVNQMSDNEINKIINETQREKTLRNRNKQEELRKKVVITEFKDQRVKPFDKGAIYKLWNEETGSSLTINGIYLEGLIAANDTHYRQWENKNILFPFIVGNKEVEFLNYEIN